MSNGGQHFPARAGDSLLAGQGRHVGAGSVLLLKYLPAGHAAQQHDITQQPRPGDRSLQLPCKLGNNIGFTAYLMVADKQRPCMSICRSPGKISRDRGQAINVCKPPASLSPCDRDGRVLCCACHLPWCSVSSRRECHVHTHVRYSPSQPLRSALGTVPGGQRSQAVALTGAYLL